MLHEFRIIQAPGFPEINNQMCYRVFDAIADNNMTLDATPDEMPVAIGCVADLPETGITLSSAEKQLAPFKYSCKQRQNSALFQLDARLALVHKPSMGHSGT